MEERVLPPDETPKTLTSCRDSRPAWLHRSVGRTVHSSCPYLERRGLRARGHDSSLVDSASSHTLVSKIKPCMSKYKYLTLKLRTAHYISYSFFDSPLLLGITDL